MPNWAGWGWGVVLGNNWKNEHRKQIATRMLQIRPDMTSQVLKEKKVDPQQQPPYTTSFCEFRPRSHSPDCPAGRGSEGSWSGQSDPLFTEAWLCPHPREAALLTLKCPEDWEAPSPGGGPR